MKRFSTMNEYVAQNVYSFKSLMERDARSELLIAIKESGYYDDIVEFGIDVVLENNLTDRLFEGNLTGEEFAIFVNEWNMIEWGKKKYQQAKEWVKEKGQQGKEMLSDAQEFLLKIGGDILQIPKLIGEAIAGFFKNGWDWLKGLVAKKNNEKYEADKEDTANKVANWKEEEIEELGGELAAIQKMITEAVSWVTGDAAKSIEKGAANAVKEIEPSGDPEEKNEGFHYSFSDAIEKASLIAMANMIKEDSSILVEFESFNKDKIDQINEGGDDKGWKIPFLSKIMHFIAKNIPPFSILHKIESLAGKVVGGIFNILSAMVKFIKTGSFEGYQTFTQMGKITGMVAVKAGGHASIKHGAMEAVKWVAKKAISRIIINAMPGFNIVWHILETAASVIWWAETIEMIIALVYKVIKQKFGPDNKAVKALGWLGDPEGNKSGKGIGKGEFQVAGKAVDKAQAGIDKVKKKVGDAFRVKPKDKQDYYGNYPG